MSFIELVGDEGEKKEKGKGHIRWGRSIFRHIDACEDALFEFTQAWIVHSGPQYTKAHHLTENHALQTDSSPNSSQILLAWNTAFPLLNSTSFQPFFSYLAREMNHEEKISGANW